MNFKKEARIAIGVFFILFFAGFVSAADSINATEKDAIMCLNESRLIMAEMSDSGFNILSINDTIKQADIALATQNLLKEKRKLYDYAVVIGFCNSVKSIHEEAIIARDDFNSLMKFYNDSLVGGMETSQIDLTIKDINLALSEERYKDAEALVNQAYNEISESKSANTAVSIIYQTTSRGLKNFFLAKNRIFQLSNWMVFSIGAVIIVIFLLIYRTSIKRRLLNTRIERLKNRKKTVKGLVMQTQKDYFQYGKIPEGEYNIKTKRFAEIVRDIDREIPLLQESLAKLGENKK